jgi:hypothetical protein
MSSSPTESSQTSKSLSFRRLSLDDFEVWRPRMTRLLIFASMLLVAYWAFWLADRNMVASDHTPAYISFEQSFPLADGWLAAAALLAAIQLWRRRPSALMWLMVVGGAGMYLCAMDVLYDLQHRIYTKPQGRWHRARNQRCHRRVEYRGHEIRMALSARATREHG